MPGRTNRTNGRVRKNRIETQLDDTTQLALEKAAIVTQTPRAALAYQFIQDRLRQLGYLADLPKPQEFI